MNRPVVAGFSVCIIAFLAVANSARAALTHRWTFSETTGTNFADSVGAADASVFVLAGGGGYTLSNGAVRIDGGTRATADYIQLTADVFDGLTNATIEIWAEPHTFQNNSRLIDMGDGAVNPTTNNFRLTWVNGANGNQQVFGVRGYTASVSALTTIANQLYHYAIVWQSNGGPGGQGLVSWYRDGVFVTNQLHGTSSIAAIANLPSPIVWLSRSPFTADNGANASYHELRTYSHAMSPTEIFVSRTNGPDTIAIPPAQAFAVDVVTNTANRLTTSWSNGAGSAGTLVVVSPNQAPLGQPTNGVTYAANSVFGSGANLGNTNYVVYVGSGTSVTITNLTPGVRYYATAYSYSGSGASTVYNLANASTDSEIVTAVAQAISLTADSTMSLGASSQATVLANYGGGIFGDVTASSTYSSSATGVVSVSASGVLTASAFGSAWITASFQTQVSSNLVTVVDPLTVNLKHRYTFATDASDFAGTAHGTLEGGATIITNNALFNGTTAFVNLPNNLVTGFTSITIETWATDNGSGGWGRIFDFGNNDAGEDLQGGGTQYMFLSLPSGAGNLRAAITTAGGAGEQLCEWAGNRPAVGARSHIVFTLDDASNIARLYVNGVQVGVNSNMTLTPAAMGPTVNNWLGKSVWPDPYFNGTIDEFRIYDIALGTNIVVQNYLNGPDALVTPPPTTVADSATLNTGAKVLIPVLANDVGPAIAPATLQVIASPVNGSAVVKPDGKILYMHNGSATTSDAFSYRVQNTLGSTSAVATVSLTISSALRLAAPMLNLPPASPPTVLQVVDALSGVTFTQPICLATIPGNTQRLFVCERMAKVQLVTDVTAALPTKQVFLDIQQVVSGRTPVETIEGGGNQEHGLLGLAFHPGYATNGYFYVAYTVRISGGSYYQRISRFTVSAGNTNQANPSSELILLQQLDEGSNHDGGDIHFGHDGYLYYAAGDEENPNDFRLNSQIINKDFFGGVFRFDVDKRPGNLAPNPHAAIPTDSGVARFSVPNDNPYVYTSLGGTWNGTYNGITNVSSGADLNLTTIRTEFWATGLRHTWRMSFDSVTGDLWGGDVGQGTYEEVNLIVKGGNYGWVFREGAHNTGLRTVPPGFTSIDPVYEHLHTGIAGGDAQFKGNSVCGGVVYRGNRIPDLYGHYIWCDSVSGHIWGRNPNTAMVTRLTGVPGAYGGLVSMGVDPSNKDVLFCDYINGRILRLTASAAEGSFPQTLSDTGAFADLTDLSPNPGLVDYDPIVAFWSDHAIKRRWFSIPNLSDTVTHVVDGSWTLPAGMVWVKHFDMEMTRGNPATKRRLETRFVVKTTNSIYGVSYAWNAAGTEAYLVPDAGTNFNLTITNGLTTITQQWAIPSRSECLSCHTALGGYALSYNTRQMNQTATISGFTGNQLSLLSAAGYFSNPVNQPQTLPAFSRADDSAVSLEHRARSYFSVNCVQCHQPGGGSPGTWDARAWLSLYQTSLINGELNNNGGNPANKLIIPGDTAHSVVLHRIRGNGFSRMPPLATAVIDDAATNLLHAWISTELTNRQSFAQWQLAIFGSTNAANALATADSDGDGASNYYEYLTQTSPTNAVPAPWNISIDEAANTVGVSFQRIANLGFVVETSTNFTSWSVWNVPDNTLWFSASNFLDTVTGPLTGEPDRYYRVKIYEP